MQTPSPGCYGVMHSPQVLMLEIVVLECGTSPKLHESLVPVVIAGAHAHPASTGILKHNCHNTKYIKAIKNKMSKLTFSLGDEKNLFSKRVKTNLSQTVLFSLQNKKY